jgi:RNA polymerase sigma factor (TIGR02999 family)
MFSCAARADASSRVAWRPRSHFTSPRCDAQKIAPTALSAADLFGMLRADWARGAGQMEKEIPDGQDEIGGGNERSSRDQMFAALYRDLRRLANRELQRSPGGSISPTTLVHEVYLNFSGRDGLSIDDRERFLAYSARAMRGVLIDLVRRRQALKRGAGFQITRLSTDSGEEFADVDELARLSDALDALAAVEPRLAEVVDLKYFCGLSLVEIAALRGASERTVQRDWEKARLILFQELGTKTA